MIHKIKHIKSYILPVLLFSFFTLKLLAHFEGNAIQDPTSCTHHILKAENKLGIPSGLLLALSLVETSHQGRPHPFAVHLSGKSYYADNAEKADRLIHHKNGSLRRNSSVGCMQLQVTYHKDAFSSTYEMLNPEANVNYGAHYLAKHYKRYKDWGKAVKRYNGGKYRQKRAYVCKVYRTLKSFNQSSAALIKQPYCSQKRKSPYISLATLDAFNNAQNI